MSESIYIIELENKHPEFVDEYLVAVIAKNKEEAEGKVRKKYSDLDIESVVKYTVSSIIK